MCLQLNCFFMIRVECCNFLNMYGRYVLQCKLFKQFYLYSKSIPCKHLVSDKPMANIWSPELFTYQLRRRHKVSKHVSWVCRSFHFFTNTSFKIQINSGLLPAKVMSGRIFSSPSSSSYSYSSSSDDLDKNTIIMMI